MPRELLSLVVGLGLLLVTAMAGGDHGSSWWPFVGRFHPLLVHLPIGVLLLALAADVMARWAPRALAPGALAPHARAASHWQTVVSPLLWLGAWLAISSGMVGLILADWGSYDPDTLAWHRRLGLSVAALSVLAYWCRDRYSAGHAVFRIPYAIAASLLASTLVLGGHLGATLSRDDGYLTQRLPDNVREAIGLPLAKRRTSIPIASADSAPVYDALIQPTLTRRCAVCHNAERKKGGLILTNAKGLFAGGRQGKILVAGNADDSEMIIRLVLPPGHTDAMPPDRPMPAAELALIRWWIDQGASTTVPVSAIARPASIRRTLAAYGLDALPTGVLALSVSRPDSAAIAVALKTGLTVHPLGTAFNFLSVDANSQPAGWAAGSLRVLAPLVRNIATVDLARSAADDSALVTLGTMPHLARLQLSNTRVTDAGLRSLRSLQYLEYLNLVGTDIGDAGLRSLEQLPRLRHVYLWGTRVTDGGVARLQRALPHLAIARAAPMLIEPTAPDTVSEKTASAAAAAAAAAAKKRNPVQAPAKPAAKAK